MTKDQWAAVIVTLGILAGAIQQFYSLKTEVAELRLRLEYIHGTNWTVPPKEK